MTGDKWTEIEVDLSDEDLAQMRAASPFPINLGDDETPRWVMCTMIDEDGEESITMTGCDDPHAGV